MPLGKIEADTAHSNHLVNPCCSAAVFLSRFGCWTRFAHSVLRHSDEEGAAPPVLPEACHSGSNIRPHQRTSSRMSA